MKQFITVLGSIALLANLIFAAPSIELTSHAHPKDKVDKRISNGPYWAGAVLESPPAGQTFKSVTGSWTVAQVQPAGSGEGTWTYTQWVGLDGSTDGDVILQGGIYALVTRSSSGSLEYQYSAWTEWYPARIVIQGGFVISAGHSITVTVTADSPTQGTVAFINHSTGKSQNYTLTAPSASDKLPEMQAEWIVEDDGGDQLGDFSPLSFAGCSATTRSGQSVGPQNAATADIYRDGRYLARGAVHGDTVTVTHA